MNPETPLQPGDLVDETEAAAILACAVQTLRNHRWRGTGVRFYKIGQRLVRYRRGDLADYVARGASEQDASA